VALSVGTLMLVWMLVSAASGQIAYEAFHSFASSFVGQILLFGWTGAMFFHLCSGIRHLMMDAGYLLTIPQAEKAGRIIFIVSIALTISVWASIKFFNGDV
jgi:succinate dehydrogenase / fumarate reductase cytochrome b subunit